MGWQEIATFLVVAAAIALVAYRFTGGFGRKRGSGASCHGCDGCDD